MLDLRYRTILAMAIPLMGSTFIQSIVLITDSSFLSRYDTVAFDAAGNAGLIYLTLFMALVGISDGAQILMARRIGQSKEGLLSRIFGTTLLINLLFVLVLLALIQFIIPDLILSYCEHQDVALGQIDYIQIRGYGLLFSLVSLVMNAYFMAMGKTVFVLISALITAFSNIGLDYVFIFGHYGVAEMGLKGAALASTIADGIGMIFLTVVLYFNSTQRRHKIFSEMSYNYHSFKEVFRLGTPIVLQGVLALSTWTVFFVWIEQIGKFELTVSQNIRALYFLAFVPVWGFGATAKTYVSQYAGRQEFKEIKIIVRKIQLLTVVFLIVFFHGAILYPETMISLVNPNPEYMQQSVAILRFTFGSVLICGVGSVYFHAINGTGNTRYTFYVEGITVVLYIISAYLLIKIYKVELFWVWSVEYIYFGSISLFSFIYMRFFNWQKKQI